MPDLKTLLSFLLGLFLLIPLQAAAEGVPTPSDYGDLFGTRTGDAYSSVLLNQMFGPLFPSAALPEGNPGVRTVFSSIIGYFNVIILVIGGLMFFYNVTVGVLQSAHEGQVLGQRWSSLWAPLRVLFAVGLLVPVPNYGGYNLAQVGVAYVVKGSTNIASEIWKNSVTFIFEEGIPIATSETRFSPQIIRTLYQNEVCMALLNYQYGPEGVDNGWRVIYSPTSNPVETRISTIPVRVGGGGVELSQTYPKYVSTTFVDGSGSDRAEGVCGRWSTPDLPAYLLRVLDENPDDAVATRNIMTAFAIGHRDIMIHVSSRIRNELVTQTGHDAAPLRADVFGTIRQPAPFTSALSDIARDANARLDALVTTLTAAAQGTSGHASTRQALLSRITGDCEAGSDENRTTACFGEGWMGAGAYYTTLARANAEINSLATAMPEVNGPRFAGFDAAIDNPIDSLADTGFTFWQRLTGPPLPSEEEAVRVITRYMDLYKASSYPLATLGFQMSPSDIIDSNAEVGESSEGLLAQLGRGLNEWIQRGQMAMMSLFDPGQASDPMIGLMSTGNFLVALGLGVLGLSLITVRTAVVMVPFFSVILAAGVTLVNILPLMPFFYWILGVTGYLLLVVEAIVAVNLWALAHMRMDGEGISGQAGQKGWLMLIALLMTPILMVFGFLIGMAIFRVASMLISGGMFHAVSAVSGTANPLIAFVGIFGFAILIVFIYMVLLERSFSLISEFPNRVMQWMGEGIQIGGGEGRVQAASGAAAYATNAAGNQIEKPFTVDPKTGTSAAQRGITQPAVRFAGRILGVSNIGRNVSGEGEGEGKGGGSKLSGGPNSTGGGSGGLTVRKPSGDT